jgi:uncharacterized protein
MLAGMKALRILAIVFAVSCTLAGPQQASAQASAAGAAAPAPATKTWFIRLIPPRPTFDKDMTEEEGKLMAQHFAYWKDLFDKGVCVFGGPVLDPKGVYGVLAIVAPSEDEARAIAAADPSVKGGLNKIEVAEIKIAFLPGRE